MSELLSADALRESLLGLPGWSIDNDRLTRTFAAKSFQHAIAFVTIIGMLAELADHHPDISIRYNRIRIDLSTHSEGGITRKDVELASRLNEAFFE